MGLIFDALGWLNVAAVALAQTLCIAAGLYVLCDFAEDHPAPTRKFLKRSLLAIVFLHFLLAFDPDVPASRCFLGALCHLSFLPLLRTFPVVDIVSVPAIAALLATVVNHFQWFLHFLSVDRQQRLSPYSYHDGYGGGAVIGVKPTTPLATAGFFLVFVWAVPVGFFICMTASDECLPGTFVAGGYESGEKRKRKGMFKRIIGAVLGRGGEEVDPGYTPGQGKSF